MTESTRIVKVTDLEQLNDKSLVLELKKRCKEGGLTFITSENCLDQIEALNNNELDAESATKLWQPLIESAVVFLKMSDPREWAKEYGKPSSGEGMNSLKAFGVERLNDYFVQFREFESILYGAVKYYHEHTLHVFRVWVLGALLLEDSFKDKGVPYIEFFDEMEKKTGEQASKLISLHEIQAMWCIIALSHDLGYPLQKVDNINEQTRTMLRQYAKVNLQDLNFDVPQQHQFINDFILRFISSRTIWQIDLKEEEESKKKDKLREIVLEKEEKVFRTHTQAKFYLKYSKSLEDFEHGIFSSILLMKNLTYFLESDFDMDDLKPLDYNDAKQCAIRREILGAIACHTCEEIYHIRPDTLGFLLILCDELQSWGRPTFKEIQGAGASSPIARLIKFNSQEVDFELKFPGDENELHERTKNLFRHFHKILRVAVDAHKRKFTCQVTVKSKERLPDTYKVSLEAERPMLRFTIDECVWDPWKDTINEETWDKWKLGRKSPRMTG